jgi:ABC-type transport system involved in cytochrome c biogenesis permease subunit
MRRYGWFTLGLALTLGAGRLATAADAEKPPALGVGPAYETLGKLAVMHAGRIKPIDTLAREEVKQIFGRETIKLHDDKNKVVATWGPVGALYDWAARPGFWDDQPIILVEYLPLKRLLLAESAQAELSAIAGRDTTSAADREVLKRLADDLEGSAAALNRFAEGAKLPDADLKAIAALALKLNTLLDADLKAIAALAFKLSEEHKWLSPAELEDAQVSVDGQRKPFSTWFREIAERKEQFEKDVLGKRKLPETEKRALEVGTRLVHYQTLRKREVRSVEPLLVMPHPNNPAYLAFIAKAVKKAKETGDVDAMALLELDGLKMLQTYWNNIPREDRAVPGDDARFDAKFAEWLRDGSEWVPLGTLLASSPEALAEAGFPSDKSQAFLSAFKALDEAEAVRPGRVEEAKASSLVDSARVLGEAVGPSRYPALAAMERETYFNEFNPFWKAPIAYGLALALLAVSLGFAAAPGRPRSAAGWLGRGLYLAGMLGLVAGIALEVVGFALRIRISGWAPVTNMYETVIWVSLVTAVLGLAFELIFRRTFAALAASGVALLGTVLAANVPLLDPGIRQLQPVLRSNYWLTIHVLTEVSSYAAFALAMGLGLIATLYYLTATYRRSPRFFELMVPMVPGLPMLAAGAVGLAVSYGAFGYVLTPEKASTLFYAAGTLAGVGGALSIIGGGAVVGEIISRLTFRDDESLDEAALDGEEPTHPSTSVQTLTVGEAEGAVATLAKPSLAEIRALAARTRPKLDARGRAMQETAATIKPLANFIYRTMQVGVLLVAAGTILGGIWADYSWGRFWGWDPKEVWALITLLVYLIPLHGRFAGWVNTFGLVMASVVCFLSVIMAWYGVNFVLGVGLHSYGFVEGGSQGSVGAVVLAVLSVAGAAAWRRWLTSRVPEASA